MYLNRKAIANTQAVDERQTLQTLSRDEKTSARALANLQEANNRHEERKVELEREASGLEEKKVEVQNLFFPLRFTASQTLMILQLEDKASSLQTDLARAKQELNNQQAEFARISWVYYFSFCNVNDTFTVSWRRSWARSFKTHMKSFFRLVWIRKKTKEMPG